MMNPFREIWEGYLRWRHSHGFGVHSPYAYHIVTGVIRPGDYGYYGYHSNPIPQNDDQAESISFSKIKINFNNF